QPAKTRNSAVKNTDNSDPLQDKESTVLLKRLFWSLGFLLILMYFSMGHMMWNFPLPPFFENNHVAMGLVQLILCFIIMIINKKFFISGIKSVLHGAPNMDTLVAMGSGVSFLWSLYCLFAMTDAQVKQNTEAVMNYMDNFYFESAAMILTLITVGKFLEAKSKGRTTSALKSLMKLAPKTATVIRDDCEISVDVEEVHIDDIFVIRPGETIPVDGVVVDGFSAVNESALTGESIPVDKKTGSKVSSGTLNQSGFLKCRATRVGQDTTINQIIQMVSDASSSKAPIAKIADKVSGVFVPGVIAIAVITFIVWMVMGSGAGYSLARAISVLVISCPCALGLATPVAIMVASGKGASNGILFKTAESLETTGKAKIVALDKTGTITKGQPSVTDIIPADGISETELIQSALNIESKSEHPLAKAILDYAKEKGLSAETVSEFEAVAGCGVKAKCKDAELRGGNKEFIKGLENSSYDTDDFARQGKTPLYFSKDNRLLGIICVADTIKEDSAEAIKELKKMGFEVVMLTGDNELTAQEIGRISGVDRVIAGILPEQKAKAIKDLQATGKPVIMIGDGINDAPALTVADSGIAIGKGTDVAIDAADVVLVNGSLRDAVAAIKLSQKTLVNIKENLFWAFIYNVIGIPLAAGCYIKAFGWTLNPMFGAAAMSLSSFCVVSNALRLNFVRLYSSKKNKIKNIENSSQRESKGVSMTKTLKIEGMMCPHCEAHVKGALEKIDGVTSAVTSHEKGTAVIELSKDVPENLFEAAVTEAGYKYLGQE
ncbi:MAG: cadmium-translocating P-type ATPase, partial [Treponema sp.]|uniref:heavy metal translocating P-type ATPase n=1 Tax=Treponema sp. TaxID=166 RepID=UPI00298DE726